MIHNSTSVPKVIDFFITTGILSKKNLIEIRLQFYKIILLYTDKHKQSQSALHNLIISTVAGDNKKSFWKRGCTVKLLA